MRNDVGHLETPDRRSTLTKLLLDDGSEMVVPVERGRLEQALGDGLGRIGLQDAASMTWRWVTIARIRTIDGIAWPAPPRAA